MGADAQVVIGSSFFEGIDGELPVFKEEDAELLRAVFNPKMSDRREEGASFVPPDSSAAYVGKLRSLVEAEDKVRLERVEKFLSPEFKRGEYDALFPPTWATVNIVIFADTGTCSSRLFQFFQQGELITM